MNLKCFFGHHNYVCIASYSGWLTGTKGGDVEAVFKKCRCTRCGDTFCKGVTAFNSVSVKLDYFNMCEAKLRIDE